MIRQLLAEGPVLALFDGAAGVVVTAFSLPILVSRLPQALPRLSAIHLDATALAATASAPMIHRPSWP